MWAIATQVTQDICLLTEQLVRKQHQLTLNVHLHESFEDALRVVVSWCHGQLGAAVADDAATEPVDIFAALALKLLKPLYWRASVLWRAGKEIASTEPLSPVIRDSAWESWQRNFAHFERRPGQENKSWKEMRSIFQIAVNRDVGCVHLAKAIILFGARGRNTVDQILVEVCEAKRTRCTKATSTRPTDPVKLLSSRGRDTEAQPPVITTRVS
jgi:hypothetical protein